MTDPEAPSGLEAVFRAEWGTVVATLIRLTGDWDLAEECAQDAFAAALERWPRDGVPERPGAWLTTTARNRAFDRLRRERAGAAKMRQAAQLAQTEQTGASGSPPADGFPDDRLRLMFTCCHPALSLPAQVALTLRTLAGLGTAEIARAFLVPEATMSQRLVRAKHKIRQAAIPFRVPPPHLLPQRLQAVLGVLYLLFNEGYSSPGREAVRREAIRLARLLAALLPGEPETGGLLALMLLHQARQPGRTAADGTLVPLEEQDRALWDRAGIEEGVGVLEAALGRRVAGPYQVQAAIAACHATAPDAGATDWPQIAVLYARLAVLLPSPVVELNRAVAVAMADGPAAGLELVDRLAGTGALPATRADLLRRLERRAEAAGAYRQALELATAEADRRYLARRLAELGA
ncbi:RNA polymerase sigma factor [Nonomuraea spiralis]|uniref:RNA polymerase sigma factor n=1 Tax=Nonomuraea spiralis TaxID=46182 RepID=A0ABV5I6C3_9ACTN|nr:sigma-70 family RNA polymerase sigma factor [Nonomuraea spiralis]GGS65831.1 RNA polymerase subunit sigma-24 [Nonomuraea spiralis]